MRCARFLLVILLSLAAIPCRAQDASRPDDQPGGGSRVSQPPYARIRVAIPSPAVGGDATVSVADPSSTPSYSYQQSDPVVIDLTSATGGGGTEAATETRDSGREQPKVLATLDGQAITEEDVLRELWERRGRETLEWIIGRRILEKELSRLGLVILDGEVDERLEQHLDGLRKAFPNLRTPEALTRAASGMRLDEYRERSVWVELALRKIMHSALKPTDEQLRSYYAEKQADFIKPERVRMSQVFIAPQLDPDNDNMPGPADWALAEKHILEAHSRLRMGEDFAAVARAYGAGGHVSRWVGRGELLRELEEAAFSIRPGSISAPLKSGMGYHIIRVEEKQERTLPRFEEVRGDVQAQYEEKRFVYMAGEFMSRLREKALRGGALVVAESSEPFSETMP